MMLMTDSTMIGVVNALEASGNSSRQKRSMPNVPTLSSTPASSTAAPAGAGAAAAGGQVCTGQSGALMAKAMKNPANSHFCVAGSWIAPTSSGNMNVPLSATTYMPMTATSMSSPPNSEYSRNLTAA